MALLDDGDWQAQWIGIDSSLNATDRLTGDSRLAARYLRKEFPVEGNVASARLYISGLGFYECYLNGRKINEDIFAPTATDYTKSVNYNVFDVMEFLQDKQNTIGGDPSATGAISRCVWAILQPVCSVRCVSSATRSCWHNWKSLIKTVRKRS